MVFFLKQWSFSNPCVDRRDVVVVISSSRRNSGRDVRVILKCWLVSVGVWNKKGRRIIGGLVWW